MRIDNMKKVGAYIRKRRKDRGFMVREFADMCDLSLAPIARIEHGIAISPHPLTWQKIATVLGDEVDDLLNCRATKDKKPYKHCPRCGKYVRIEVWRGEMCFACYDESEVPMRRCPTCNVLFIRQHSRYCVECTRVRKQQDYLKHKPERQAAQRANYMRNRERILKKQKLRRLRKTVT